MSSLFDAFYPAFDKSEKFHGYPPSKDSDQRYLPRWTVSNRVKYVLQDGFSVEECETRDLSCSGVCLKLSRLMLPGQNVKMKIYLDERKAIEVTGNVMWNHISPEGRLAGIAFDNPSVEVQQTILNYAFEIQPAALVKHWFSGWDQKT